jgi:hypothetical protein
MYFLSAQNVKQLRWRHNTQHNDTQHNDIQPNNKKALN